MNGFDFEVRMAVIHILTLVLLTILGNAEGQVVFDTMNGQVRGESITVNGKSLDVLRSIPFGTPPVGDLRLKPPQPADPWQGVLDATEQASACIQSPSVHSDPANPAYFSGNFSEDCLYLGLWKPSNATRGSNLPVMIWIYGGAFSIGMKDNDLFNGKFLAADYDVIVVSMNYRVGVLGFAYLGPDTLPGNLGLLDQLEAMKWVRNNIENFGGDPNKVTLFGESAGSWAVGLQNFSPLSKDFFNQAIMQSGSPVSNVVMGAVYSQERSRDNVKAFAEVLNCPGSLDRDIYKCLMGASIPELTAATFAVLAKGVAFFPVIDGYFLPEDTLQLMERGQYRKANVLMGVTKDEYSSFFGLAIFDLFNLTIYATGKKLTYQDIDWMLSSSVGIPDEAQIRATRDFYESLMPNPRENVAQLLVEIASDLIFDCSANLYASIASRSDNVYFYILNYRLSNILLPEWAGVPHGYDMELMFGLPFDPKRRNFYTDEDRQVSRMMMTYWTNFAKSGNPNSPLAVAVNWPTFNTQNQTYMALDSGSNLATRQGPRRHACAFVNEILPHISSKDEETTPVPCVLPTSSGTHGGRQDVAILAAILVLMLSYL